MYKPKKETIKKQKKPIEVQQEFDVISGILRLHPRGFGFVAPDQPSEYSQEIFIPKHLTDNAVDGDRVEIAIESRTTWEKGPEGRVLAILKRGRTHLAGTIHTIYPSGQINAYVQVLGTDKQVIVQPTGEKKLVVGDRIIMKVIQWGDEKGPTICEMSHYIGHISDPSCDIIAAIEEFDLHQNFPKAAIKEAKSFGTKVQAKDLKKRKDFTEWDIFTIDPETAKDYDDALSINKDKKGHYHLGVHIADVAQYIPAGSALDNEASIRCNSTYLPGTVIPMIPHDLSDNLCSLQEGVVRLTVSVLMEFDPRGDVVKRHIERSFIQSKKRFTYTDAKEILDEKKKSPFLPDLRLMVELCNLLKSKRHERGSIDFALPELVIVVDSKGKPTGVKTVEYDVTHQLVEEFMLKANEVVAKHLEEMGKQLLYRIHEEPSKESMEEFTHLARSLGFYLPKKPDFEDIQELFQKAKGTSLQQQLAVRFIRSMKLAAYSPENIGHFGLALEHYCHFTSPIRRYSDLITQRLLFNEEGKNIDLEEISRKCSEQERISFRAEMGVKLLKKLRLLNDYFLDNPERTYRALITRVKPFGLYFEMQDLVLEGFLHISELENDYFVFNPKIPALVGRQTKKKHMIGEEIQVKLLSVDFIFLDTKWELITKMARAKKTKKRR